jgi:zinc protease
MKSMRLLPVLIAASLMTGQRGTAQSDIRELNVEGLKVIFKKIPKEVATASFFIRGGVANQTDSTQGIEALALSLAIRGGTQSLNKGAFATEAEKMGTRYSSVARQDYSSFNMSCLLENWNKSWQLFTEAILHPAMDSGEFQTIRQQMLASARQQESNPDAYLRKLASEQLFHGTPYARMPNGIPETLEKLNLSEVRQYYAGLTGKKNCFLVVVGNLDEKDLVQRVRSGFSHLPEGNLAPANSISGVSQEEVQIKDRNIATNYILGNLNGPKYYTADGPLFEFAMSILYDRYFVELRTKRSLSYAPAAFYNNSMIDNPLVQLYISTIDPKQSLQVMTDIINDVKANGFTPKEVADKKKEYLTNYYVGNESSSSQAGRLGFCEASGNWRLYDEVNRRIGQVNADEVSTVFRKYMNHIAWTYLGKKDKVEVSDFKQPAPAGKNLPASKISEIKKG